MKSKDWRETGRETVKNSRYSVRLVLVLGYFKVTSEICERRVIDNGK